MHTTVGEVTTALFYIGPNWFEPVQIVLDLPNKLFWFGPKFLFQYLILPLDMTCMPFATLFGPIKGKGISIFWLNPSYFIPIRYVKTLIHAYFDDNKK